LDEQVPCSVLLTAPPSRFRSTGVAVSADYTSACESPRSEASRNVEAGWGGGLTGVRAGSGPPPGGPESTPCGRGAEVVAVSGAESGGSGTSLDLGKNNSTAAETDDNGRYDCRDVFSNFEFEQVGGLDDADGDPPTAAYRCGSWDCYCCGYRMRQNLVEEIERITSERPELCRMLTLTLDPETAPSRSDQQHGYITDRWNALRTRLKREVGDFSYIWVREEQKNGLPHLHILVSRYLPQQTVAAAWSELGGGEIVDIRKIDRLDKAAHYVGKYLTKDSLTGLPDGIRRYGSSADLDLAVRDGGDSDDDWRLLMDDYEITIGDGEPLRRGVVQSDFSRQLQWKGPVPPDAPPPD
jgi:hypothetical protein